MVRQLAALIDAMAEYDRGEPELIQHFLKVHDLASVIGTLEGLTEEELFLLETIAIVHDIGIRKAIEIHGSSAGPYQEQEGPEEAEKLLRALGGYTEEQIARVRYVVGHHHTYKNITGMDYQILVEADFLVNLYENHSKYTSILAAENRIFKTGAGIRLLENMFQAASQ